MAAVPPPLELRTSDPAAVVSLPGIELELPEAEKIAERRQREGRLADAATLYGQIVEAVPGHAGALMALGGFVLRVGQLTDAVVLFQRAADAEPGNALAQTNLGAARAMQGQLAAAETALRRGVAIDPDYADAHRNLGVVLHRMEHLAEAETELRRAMELAPGHAKTERNLAALLLDADQPAEAAELYRRVISRQPRRLAGHLGLASALQAMNDRSGAIETLERATALDANSPQPLLELGRLFLAAGQTDTAIERLSLAAGLAPNDAAVQTALAEALLAAQRISEAADACELAIAADSTHVPALLAFAGLLDALDRSLDLLAVARQALDLQPDSQAARHCLAAALLKSGDFATGWPAFEAALPAADPPFALWEGEPIAGRQLLVQATGDIDDILLLARLLPAAAAGGSRVLLRCPEELRELFEGLPGVAALLAPGSALPLCDYSVPLAHLPRLLGMLFEAIPSTLGWLRPTADRADAWRQRLASVAAPRIGLIWQAGPGSAARDPRASLPIAALAQLVGRSHGSFFALNAEDRRAEIESAGLADRIVDLGAELAGPTIWAEMAAVLDSLDLLIAVDSPAIHLAGALGRPAWLLLPQPADWRWFRERSDSPWYPTVRLLRQPKPGDWDSVVDEAIARLGDEEPA